MSEPKRPGQGRSAVPEFTQTDFAVHDGSNAGRMDTDLLEMGSTLEAEATPLAMKRLINMLSSTQSGRDDAVAQPSVTPVQRQLFTKLIASLEDSETSETISRSTSATAGGGVRRQPADDDLDAEQEALRRRARVKLLRDSAIAKRKAKYDRWRAEAR